MYPYLSTGICLGIYGRCGMENFFSLMAQRERRRPCIEQKARPGWSWQENVSARGLDLTRPLRAYWSPVMAWLPPVHLTES